MAAVTALALVAFAAGGAWLWERARPARLAIVAVPDDALVEVEGQRGTGRLDLGELQAGRVAIRVSRRGYHPLEATVDLHRGEELTLNYELIPRAWPLEVRGEGAVEVRQGEAVRAGTLPYAGDVLAGPLEVRVGDRVWSGSVDGALCLDDELAVCGDPP